MAKKTAKAFSLSGDPPHMLMQFDTSQMTLVGMMKYKASKIQEITVLEVMVEASEKEEPMDINLLLEMPLVQPLQKAIHGLVHSFGSDASLSQPAMPFEAHVCDFRDGIAPPNPAGHYLMCRGDHRQLTVLTTRSFDVLGIEILSPFYIPHRLRDRMGQGLCSLTFKCTFIKEQRTTDLFGIGPDHSQLRMDPHHSTYQAHMGKCYDHRQSSRQASVTDPIGLGWTT